MKQNRRVKRVTQINETTPRGRTSGSYLEYCALKRLEYIRNEEYVLCPCMFLHLLDQKLFIITC